MPKANSFTVRSLTIEGFKCFKDRTEFTLGGMSIVKGANGLGKSSIADAIAFAFTGTSFFGDRGTDKLCNPNSKRAEVTVNIMCGDGKEHELSRAYTNGTTTVTFDGNNARQSDINEIFGERDLFLSIFNPLYMAETMGSDAKSLLETLLPAPDHSAVLDALPKNVKAALDGKQFVSPEVCIKNSRSEIRELEGDIKYLQGQADLREEDAKEVKAMEESLNAVLLEINGSIGTMEAMLNDKQLDPEDEEKLAEMLARLEELAGESNDMTRYYSICDEIDSKLLAVKVLKQSKYVSGFTPDIAKKEAELELLYKQYDEIRDAIKNTTPGHECASCTQALDGNNLDAAKKTLSNKLMLCVEAGMKAKSDLANLQAQDEESRIEFKKNTDSCIDSLQNEILKHRKEIGTETTKHNNADWERKKKLDELMADINVYEDIKKNGRLSPERLPELTELRTKKREHEAKLEICGAMLNRPSMGKQIKAAEERITNLKTPINNLGLYIGRKNELLLRGLGLNRVGVSLTEVVKTTGEVKDTFKFTYNGTEYKRLSMSEKIKTGLELAELVKRLSSRDYPTFIDNAESVCVIDNVRPTSQLIFAYVEKGKALSVTGRYNSLRKAG